MSSKRQEKKKPYSKEEYRKQKKKEERKNIILMIVIGAIILVGVLGYYKLRGALVDSVISEHGNADTFDEDMMIADSLTLTGNFENLTMHASIESDGEYLGAMIEENSFDPTIYIKAENQTLYSFRQSKEESDRMGCRVFEFVNDENQIIGYATLNKHEAYAFLDADFNETGYDCEQNGKWIAYGDSMVATSSYTPMSSNDYYSIDTSYSTDAIPAEYKCFMLYLLYNAGYSYHESGVIP